MRILSALCVGLVSLTGCADSSSPTTPAGRMRFTTVAAAKASGVAGPQVQTVVRDAATWGRIWSELWGGQPPARPAVDFSRDMVAVVTGSEICFGGATIEEIRLSDGELVVRYADAAPSLCLCAQPELAFHAVRLERTPRAATFEARITPPLCPA